MDKSYTIFIGTSGFGLQYSRDGGETWKDTGAYAGGPREDWVADLEGIVRALAVDPSNPHRVYAGTDNFGIYRSEDNGTSWTHLKSPMEGLEIWSVEVDPNDSDTLYVGTRPNGFRTRDGGKTWDKLEIGVDQSAPLWPPRTTKLLVDPRDRQTIWASVEVDGVHKSTDGGDSWSRMTALGPKHLEGKPEYPFYSDVHCIAVNAEASTVIASTPFGVATSHDEGKSWDYHQFPEIGYCRCLLPKPGDPNTMYLGNGDTIPGQTGTIRRTKDGGKSWEQLTLPVKPNSVVYWLGTHANVPDTIVASSIFGYVYLSEDGGESWTKLDREFGEVRSVAVTPN